MNPSDPILSIKDLVIRFHGEAGVVHAVNGLSLAVQRGEVLGLVGESGCGKSVTALAVLGLLPAPPARVEAGEILFEGRNLLDLDAEALRRIRGDRIAMIFQEPMTSLNPVFPVGTQIAEPLMVHRGLSRTRALERAVELLREVQIPAPEQRIREYPHQLSGGMRQRVMIAMALACRPAILIADEPTTALDVTVQAQILDLLQAMRREHGMAVLLITHDLGVVAQTADRILVMYSGEIVEAASAADMFARPRHPYTRGLLDSVPRIGDRGRRLHTIPGSVSDLRRLPAGCLFADRCRYVSAECRRRRPGLVEVQRDHWVRCFKDVGVPA